MSVIVKDEEGKTFLFSKGADRLVLLSNLIHLSSLYFYDGYVLTCAQHAQYNV
jgi:magnesium-transporting ATPase (P-type)